MAADLRQPAKFSQFATTYLNLFNQRGSEPSVKSSRIKWAEKSSTWYTSTPTCADDFSRPSKSPQRYPEASRATDRKSGSPQHRISLTWAEIASNAPPPPREIKYERGPNDETWNLKPPRAGEFSGRNNYRCGALWEATAASFKPYAGARNFHIR